MNNFLIGKEGQDLVLNDYLSKGYSLIVENFEYRKTSQQGRLGEIDLIFLKDKTLFFVEVKSRNNSKFGPTVEQISRKKLQTLYRAILYFFSKKDFQRFSNFKSQFDAAIVDKGLVEIYANCYNFDSIY